MIVQFRRVSPGRCSLQIDFVSSMQAEFRRYKALAEAAAAQLPDADLLRPAPGGNSVGILFRHLGGNLASRFTDFLTTDGEKPWREREGEFAERTPTRAELMEHWERGWVLLFAALDELEPADLARTVTIRGTQLTVPEALHRSLAHVAYHVGQIVHIARGFRGEAWHFLSVPPGGSAAYNRNPTAERAGDHAARLTNPPS